MAPVDGSAEEVGDVDVLQKEVSDLPAVVEVRELDEPAPEPVMADVSDPPSWVTTDSAGNFMVVAGGVSLSVPLKTMPVMEGVVNPPTYEDAYLIEGYGTPNGGGTSYVAMHSARGLEGAAGNALIDIETGLPTLEGGEWLLVDRVAYEVTEVRLVGKGSITEEPGIWEQVDGRLVVFTCMQLHRGPSLDNVVIIAEAR